MSIGEDQAVPRNVRELLERNIDSVEQLEVLLLLQRRPERAWSSTDVSRELRGNLASTAERLAELCARGLLTREPKEPAEYRLSTNPEVNEGVGRLAETYTERPVSVIKLIYEKPHPVVRTFADAFVWKREDEDG